MKFLNYVWNIIKQYLLKSKNTKPKSEIDIVEKEPFITKDIEQNGEEIINFDENNSDDLVSIKIYLPHTMSDRLGPNDFCITYDKNKKDTNTILYL